LTIGDGNLSDNIQTSLCLVKTAANRGHVQDAVQDCGAVTVPVDPQCATLREKNLDDMSSNVPRLR
jgi:hypothetical protein